MASMPAQMPVNRPTIHFTANGWINDPCAPGYDPWTKTYHLFYQCNPASCEWGNMSWGHITSKDLLTWETISESPALVPDQVYDSHGVFTGCWIPPQNALDKTLKVVYSSVNKLPFHWSTPPYPRDAAGLAVAVSHDGGNTWEKSAQNPILSGEPAGVHVTGFRDPYVTGFPPFDDARGVSTAMLYGLVSGGIQGSGPTTFLYEIHPDRVDEWKYLGPLVDMPMRLQPSSKWSGNYGVNWECTNIVTLRADSETRHFLILGTEGDVEKDHVKHHDRPDGTPSRTVRAQLWLSGQVESTTEGIKFRYKHGGPLDHGTYYAANSFLDHVFNRRIVYGWIPEEDITMKAAERKGWNGALAIPREITLLRIPQVQRAMRSQLSDIYPFEVKSEPDGSTTILTLGVKPIHEMTRLREASDRVLNLETVLELPETEAKGQQTLPFQTKSATWELEATISLHAGCDAVGFHLRHSNDLSTRTSVTFKTVTESIVVDREASTDDPTINKCPDAGPFTLLTRRDLGRDGKPTVEKLQIRIFSDGDILEVFANDRFALATMVYSEHCSEGVGGITAFAVGDVGSAVFETVTVWDGLGGIQKRYPW